MVKSGEPDNNGDDDDDVVVQAATASDADVIQAEEDVAMVSKSKAGGKEVANWGNPKPWTEAGNKRRDSAPSDSM